MRKTVSKSKFEINTLPGGKFALKFSEPKPTFTEDKEHNSELLEGKVINHTNSARKLVRGEKRFNNIPILLTPTKQKLDFAVGGLVSNFSGSPCDKHSDQDTNLGSPAKRRKWAE